MCIHPEWHADASHYDDHKYHVCWRAGTTGDERESRVIPWGQIISVESGAVIWPSGLFCISTASYIFNNMWGYSRQHVQDEGGLQPMRRVVAYDSKTILHGQQWHFLTKDSQWGKAYRGLFVHFLDCLCIQQYVLDPGKNKKHSMYPDLFWSCQFFTS